MFTNDEIWMKFDDVIKLFENGTKTSEQALESIMDIVRHDMSYKVPGSSTTILYSGGMSEAFSIDGEPLRSHDVAKEMANINGSYGLIDKTQAGQILDNSERMEQLFKRIGLNEDQAKNMLYGDPVNGVWGVASDRFASQISGDVVTLTPWADSSRTFTKVEIENLLNNPNVKTINGESVDFYRNIYDHHKATNPELALEKVRQTMGYTSAMAMADNPDIKIKVTDASGAPRTATGADLSLHVLNDGGGMAGGLNRMEEYASTVEGELNRMRAVAGTSPNTHKYLNTLKYVGAAGFVVGLIGVASEVQAAINNGDYSGAAAIAGRCLAENSLALGVEYVGGKMLLRAAGSQLVKQGVSKALGRVGVRLLLAAMAGGPIGVLGALALGLAADYVAGKIVGWVAEKFGNAYTTTTPLVLDLDGDGVETTNVEGGNVLFDFDGDGNKNKTGWVHSDDGLLVFDRNGDGVINDGLELFGNNTDRYDGTGKCRDGYEALAQEDTNGDGVVNHLDDNWANLKVWRDLNQDGISQADELFSLEELGISGLEVGHDGSTRNQNGNILCGQGSYIDAEGNTQAMTDAWFQQNTFEREYTDTVEIPEELNVLPNMGGSGAVRDLLEAVSKQKETWHPSQWELEAYENGWLPELPKPPLEDLLTQYSEATTRAGQMALLDQLLLA